MRTRAVVACPGCGCVDLVFLDTIEKDTGRARASLFTCPNCAHLFIGPEVAS